MLRNFPSPTGRRAFLIALLAIGAGASGPSAAEPAGDAERGRRLMAQYQCGRCHAIPGVAGAGGRLAVPLDAFGLRSYIAGRIPNGRAALERWIVDPPSLVPGTLMPNLGVSAAEAHDIAAYLGALR
jgi:cytochrome c